MIIICLTGLDGAGKTTLARDLVRILRGSGTSTDYAYGRTVPIVSRVLAVLARAFLLRQRTPWLDYHGYESSKQRYVRAAPLRSVYAACVWVDYYLVLWWKLAAQLLRRPRVLIIDRYIYDTVINDLAAQLGYSIDATLRIIERQWRLAPRPELTLFLDVPEEVAFSRKNDVPHADYLRKRRPLYLGLVAFGEVVRLDGSQPRDGLLAEALSCIQSRLPGIVSA